MQPDDEGDIEVDVEDLFADCLKKVEGSDDTKAAEATLDFLNKMLGQESKVRARSGRVICINTVYRLGV